MFEENKILNKLLGWGRRIIPRQVFKWAQPMYHWILSMLGAVLYGFPSRKMRIIAVTGTKGKSTTVYMISKVFEDQGLPVAAIGSLGFKIKDKAWPNTLKMTLPGRMKLQKFLYRARQNFLASASGAKTKSQKNLGGQAKRADTLGYVILEATSEGIVQNRLAGVRVDCAVFTNLHREHIESHGSFENYMAAKQRLFLKTRGTHVLNIDDPYFEKFANFPAKHKVTYGQKWGVISSENLKTKSEKLRLKLWGVFNQHNALAALSVAYAYNLDMDKAVTSLNSIEVVPGRMEMLHSPKNFDVVIDYAHTPDSLELVYKTLRQKLETADKKLICVLGAAGGGRDKWKRPEFGKIAAQYCDEIILTDEDPYDENPHAIIEDIERGFSSISNFQFPISNENPKETIRHQKIIDRREAIKTAINLAREGDVVAITGKGSETTMAVAGGKKIPWSDKDIVEEFLH